MRQLSVETCSQADTEHKNSQRQYAHTFHRQGVICVSKAFWQLPERTRIAILLHEAGHILAGQRAGEVAANNAAERYSGVAIEYRDSPHGQELEWIAPEDVAAAKEALGLSGISITPAEDLTDRAKRYRAQNIVQGPKECVICGAKRNLDVMHLDGDEADLDPRNLAYGCRSCNSTLSAGFKRIGAGVRTVQYANNPKAGEIPSFAQYGWAVSQHRRGAHDEGGKIIHATPRYKRIEYAQRIADLKRQRGEDVPF